VVRDGLGEAATCLRQYSQGDPAKAGHAFSEIATARRPWRIAGKNWGQEDCYLYLSFQTIIPLMKELGTGRLLFVFVISDHYSLDCSIELATIPAFRSI